MMMRRGASSDRAEDLAQETLLRIWRSAPQFEPGRATASAWIYTIARNLSVDFARRDRRAAAWLEQEHREDEEEECTDEPERHLLMAERDHIVRTTIATLPVDQAQVITLSFFDGLAHSEIAERLDIPLGTVKSRIWLAFQRLRERIGEPQ
jgi:RNA polymerase sigma-70 factor (ECF subfamily)